MIACIGIGISLGWAIPAFIPEEGPSPDILRVPEEPKEPVVPEEPVIPEIPRVPLLDQIIANGSLTIGTSADYPPYENVTFPTGEIIGFDINLSAMIANELNVSLQIINMNFDSLISACVAGTFDIIVAAMTYTPSRAEILAPSITYINDSQVVMVRNASTLTISNLDGLDGLTVGCISGSAEYDELIAIGSITVIAYTNVTLLIQDIVAGSIDAAYVREPFYTAWSQTEALRVIFSTGSDSLAIWCRLEEPELLYVINKVIFEAYLTGVIYNLMKFWFS